MRTHGLLWLVLTILLFLLSPLVISPDSYIDVINQELSGADSWYAPHESEAIADRGEGLYRLVMVKSGIDPAIKRFMIRDTPSTEISPGMQLPSHIARWANHFIDYWAGLLCNVHLFTFRIAHAITWLGYLAPFLLAISFDGLMTRQAKIESVKYTSPTAYNVSWHLMIAIVCFSVVYFASSVPVPVLYYPICITIFGVMIRVLIGNIQHSA